MVLECSLLSNELLIPDFMKIGGTANEKDNCTYAGFDASFD